MFQLSTVKFFCILSGFRLQASNYKLRLAGCCVWLAAFVPAHSQDTLSLARAIEIGLANNFGVQIQKLNVEAASMNNTWG
ncbi:MAG: hypothetical protein ACK5R0_05970, partial [Bacteroidota bacterium]